MQRLLLLVASLVVLGSAQASEVFVTKDAQGRPIYTDRPDSLPAQKVHVASQSTDAVAVQQQYDEKMKSYSEADKAQGGGDEESGRLAAGEGTLRRRQGEALPGVAHALPEHDECAPAVRARLDGRAIAAISTRTRSTLRARMRRK